jgi:hypothetical protein
MTLLRSNITRVEHSYVFATASSVIVQSSKMVRLEHAGSLTLLARTDMQPTGLLLC